MLPASNAAILPATNERSAAGTIVKIYYQNVNGLRTKTNVFRNATILCDYKIIVLTETGLTESIHDTELFDSNFMVYRCDRSPLSSDKLRKGGVLIAVHTSLSSSLIKSGHPFGIEQIWVKTRIGRDSVLNVGALYIPPRAHIAQYQQYFEFTDGVIDKINETELCYLLGDFNLPDIRWQRDDELSEVLVPLNISSDCETCVVDGLLGLDLLQINGTQNSNGRILDLIFTNNYDNSSVDIASDRLLPDETHHKALELNIHIYAEIAEAVPSGPSFDFKKAVYRDLNVYFSEINWEMFLGGVNLEENASFLHNTISNAMDRFVPLRRINRGTRTAESRALNNLKHRQKIAHRAYIHSNRSAVTYAAFSQIRRQYNQLRNELLHAEIYKTECSLKSDPKKFYNFVNVRRKTSSFPSVMSLNQKNATNSDEIVDLFADYFGSVYTSHNDNVNFSSDHSNSSLFIPKLVFSEDIVRLALEKLPDSLDRGSDEIPALFLKRCAQSLAKPLCLIFNKSLEQSSFPCCWKVSNIKPLFKSGSRADVSNYRGIAKLSFIPKLFESLVCEHISFYSKSLIPHTQHGFVKGRSTATNLLEFTTFTTNAVERGHQVDTFYADFSKAFDRIDHNLLCRKLAFSGFPSLWVNWIYSYLVNRKQRVVIEDRISREIEVLSGVPQGSHLGPLLFIIFISDIDQKINNSQILLYADDCKLFKNISSHSDCAKLQDDISEVYRWATTNNLQLNIKKCNIYSFHRARNSLSYDYSLGGDILQRPELIADLGVTYDAKISFIPHMNKVIAKARAKMGFVIRNSKQFKDPYTLKTLYCSLIRSVLEYSSTIWSPSYAIHIKRIESVQKRFLLFTLRNIFRNIERSELPPYKDRLKLITLETLYSRRVTADLVFMFKLVSGSIDLPNMLARISFNTRINYRRQNNLIYLPTQRTNYGQQQPFYRMCSVFNQFSTEVDFNLSIRSIRCNVSKILNL